MADGPLTREEIEELLVALIKEGKISAPADRSKLKGEAGDNGSRMLKDSLS